MHFSSEDTIIKEKFPEDFLPVDFGGKGMSLEKLQGIDVTLRALINFSHFRNYGF